MIALALLASSAARAVAWTEAGNATRRLAAKAECVDDDAFKASTAYLGYTCERLKKKPQPRRSELCSISTDEAGRTAAAACPKACGVCEYEAFMRGKLKIALPLPPPATRKHAREFRHAWTDLLTVRYPIARTIVAVDVAVQPELLDKRYDAIFVQSTDAAAAAAWKAKGISLVVPPTATVLPFAERASDVVVADASSPRFASLDDDRFRKWLVELTRVLADDGPLVLLHLGDRAKIVSKWLSSKQRNVDVCHEMDQTSSEGQPYDCGKDEKDRFACVALKAILRPVAGFRNVFERLRAPPELLGACCIHAKYAKKACPRRCTRFSASHPKLPTIADATRQALVLREAPVGRLRFWNVKRLVASYDRSWATSYERRHPTMWHQIYVGDHGFLPDKREWPLALEQLVSKGDVASILDAGAGACSLDAHFRKTGVRSKLRVASFGFYDCSMARVASERGSLVIDWSWVDPLPFCDTCTFDVVFQAEGIHHTTPKNFMTYRPELCRRDPNATSSGREMAKHWDFKSSAAPALSEKQLAYKARRRRDSRRPAAAPRRANTTGATSEDGRRRLLWKKRKVATPRPTSAPKLHLHSLNARERHAAMHVLNAPLQLTRQERQDRRVEGGLACAHTLWKLSFDNLGKHVACGGYLYVTDSIGRIFDSRRRGAPRCWPEFGARWAKAHGWTHVQKQEGADQCGTHYPFLFLKKEC